jgi:endoglucanase
MASPIPDLLRSLLAASGPSGREDEAARVWRDAASGFAQVSSDTLGTSYARVGPGEGAPTLAIVGHVDEIGIAITNVEESGLLSFTTVGVVRAEALLAQRVDLLTRNGRVPGVIGRTTIEPGKAGERPRVELSDLHVDVGARRREEAEALVRPGDQGVWRGEPVELPNGRLVSKALDNRLGAYAALEAARRLAEGPAAEVDVVAVAAVQEELGSLGARPAAFALDPLVAIAVDVTYATDVPGGDPRRVGKVELGGGTMIAVGPSLNRRVTDLLVETAEQEGIPHGFEVYTRATMTDADEFQLARAGVPTALLSIPLRNMHTPTELCELGDVEATIALLVAFARRLRRDSSFVR